MARSIFHLLNVLKSWLEIFLKVRSYQSHFNLQLHVLFQWICSSTICWSSYDRIFGYSRVKYSNSPLFELTQPYRPSKSLLHQQLSQVLWHSMVLHSMRTSQGQTLTLQQKVLTPLLRLHGYLLMKLVMVTRLKQ